jgi:tRNA threonylcarbamoyladenosine biosynthesis protein TsaB
MKILALDTAAESCSVAVADSETDALSEISLVTRQTHSKHLLKMIQTALSFYNNGAGLDIADMDGFAVAKGPGSFTGLRIGISTVKGLAAASRKPLAGISNSDALAFQFSFSPCLICTLIDARKKEVYTSRYRFQDGILKKEKSDAVLSPDAAIADVCEPCLFVGNGALLYQTLIIEKMGELARFAPPCLNAVRASSIAHLALKRFENNDMDDIASLTPDYIRKSDAELGFGK